MLSKIFAGLFRPPDRVLLGPTLSKELAQLRELGIGSRPGIDEEVIAKRINGVIYGRRPWEALLRALGDDDFRASDAASRWLSDDIWCAPLEGIVNPGDYAVFVERLRDLSKGRLPLTDIADSLDDPDEEGTVLSFRMNGRDYRWLVNKEDEYTDYVDPELWFYLQDLFEDAGITDVRMFTCFLESEVLVVVTTPDSARQLSELTGLQFD